MWLRRRHNQTITYGLGIVVEGFRVILLDVKGIALIFETLSFPKDGKTVSNATTYNYVALNR